MISLAPSWQNLLPDALFLAPNAPQPCGMTAGHQWWGLNTFTSQALGAGASAAGPAIDAFIDKKLNQYELTESNLALVGFSQGTMMALHVGLRRKRQVAAIVGYSGMLTGETTLSSEAKTKPPVLLVHGSADVTVPVTALYASKAGLERIGIAVTTHISHGLGHSVDQVGLELGGKFIDNAMKADA